VAAEAGAAGEEGAVAVAPDSVMRTSLPTLGVGVGFREPFRPDLFLNRPEVDFLEITAEHYLDAPAEKRRELILLTTHFPLVVHGLDLSLGSAEGVHPRHVEKLAALIDEVKPPWWSEHIAFTRSGDVQIGHLSPLPFTRETVDVICRNVDAIKRVISTPLILENITYLVALPGEMSEAEFLRAVAEGTGCDLLLDVTNLFINSVNHGYEIREFLAQIPLERVVQLHFVGGHEQEGVLIDSHSRATPPEVWALMEEVLARAPVRAIALERDEGIPSFEEIAEELRRARAMARRYDRWA